MKTIKYPTTANHFNGGAAGVRMRLVVSAVFYNLFWNLAAFLKDSVCATGVMGEGAPIGVWSVRICGGVTVRRFIVEYLLHIWCMCDRASYMKMTRRTNLMQQFWFILISSLYMFRSSICPSSGVFFIYMLFTAACGVQHLGKYH